MKEILNTNNPRIVKPMPVKTILRKIIWVVVSVISIVFALGSWAVSSPIGSSPDDDYHLASIWCGQGEREDLCEKGSMPGEVVVRDTLKTNSFCFASQPMESGFCETGDESSATTRSNGGENPPIFYWVTSWFASNDLISSVIGIRVFNSVLLVGLSTLIIVLLPRYLRRVPVIGLVASAVPLNMFIIPSTNPSSWGITAILLSFASLLGFVHTHDKVRKTVFGVLSAVSMVMAAGSRPDSAFYVLITLGLIVVLTLSEKVLTIKNVSMALFVFLIAGFFFLSSGNTSATLSGAPGGGLTQPTLGGTVRNLLNLPDLWVGAFGTWGLGWLDTPLPSSVWAVTFGVFFSLVFSSIRYFDRLQALATSLVFAALILVPMAALHASGLLVGQFIQPRYLLPLLGLLLAVALYRKSEFGGIQLSRGQFWLIGFGLSVAHTIALHTNLRRYLTGLDENQVSLNFEIEWWWVVRPSDNSIFWFSPNYVWVFGSIAFIVFLISLWKLKFELGLLGESGDQNLGRQDVRRLVAPINSGPAGDGLPHSQDSGSETRLNT
jgi:hypothetical protein